MSLEQRNHRDVAFPDTPAGRIASIVVTNLTTPADELSFADIDAWYHPDFLARFPRQSDEVRRKRWTPARAVSDIASVSPNVVVFIVVYTDTRRWKITLTVEEQAPHLIIDERWEQVFDFDVKVREATPADGPALAELDRVVPILQGNAKVTFDRGDDYFADARLIERVIVAVAELDGTVAAVNWGAVHKPLIDGVEHTLATALHLRVHPDHQGRGLWGACNTKLWEYFNAHGARTSYAFVHRDNDAIQKDFSKNTKRWSVPVFRALVPCAVAAGDRTGRPAAPSDAARIVEILNATHGREEMFVPYTVDTLTARLERAPDLYTWEDIWIDGDAVVGTWPAALRVMREEGDARSESTRAFALDYGSLPGAEAQLEGLLRAWCARLNEIGTTELALFTWDGASSYPIVDSLGATLETFDLFLFNIAEPDGAAERGLYVDQIYI